MTDAWIDEQIHLARIAALEREARELAEWLAKLWVLIP
jgi:hypothetical protein